MSYQVATHQITGSTTGPHLLITGGVHGDEFEPMAAVRQLVQELEPDKVRGRVTLAPVVNEPAFQCGTRTAEDGLDLARTCPGRPDGSITEQVAHSLSSLIRSADYYVDLHTGGTRLRVQPLAGYMLHPDPSVCDMQRRMARAFGLPLIWGSDWRLDGRSLSVARDARVPAIYCEYLGGGGCDPQGVAAYVRGCRQVMIELGLLDGPRPSLSAHAVIAEDARPGAGHMQVNLPAPQAGFFEPQVELGAWVRAGQTFGAVVDTLGRRRETAPIPHDGQVIVLHSFARVDQGESLGVVLDASTVIQGR